LNIQSVILIAGFLIALGFTLFNIDDLIWDILYVISRRKKAMKSEKIPVDKLDTIPPKLLGVIVAAWHEENVIEQVIDNIIASTHYPQSMYHIFIGIYPNDKDTTLAVKRLESKYWNVHSVINTLPGPTSKSQNLNNVISYIHAFESEHNYRFASITIHDSEDVVHPYELKMTNYLIDKYDALQFPVFPLQMMPTWKTFFSHMTSGTYADEFAENHFRIMSMRDSMAAVVPSAGTGFVLSRQILDYYMGKPLFTEGSLTEDYELSIKLASKGFHVHYVLEKVPRILDNGTLKWDYITTRSLFPNQFRAAVRQKTRWIYGITMQSLKLKDLFSADYKDLSITEKYTLYRDLKSKFGALLILPSYIIFIYFIFSLFIALPPVYPVWSFSWWLCVFLTFMMIYRQIMRAIAINNVYGFRSAAFACLIPPFMPIRLIWGNIINFSATVQAWKLDIFGKPKKDAKKSKVSWSKTDHEFLSKSILHRYYRNTGDVLLEKQYLTADTLKEMLALAHKQNKRIGDVLIENNAISEEQLMIAVAASQHKLFVKNVSFFTNGPAKNFDNAKLIQAMYYPLLKVSKEYVVAQTNITPEDAYKDIIEEGYHVQTTYTTKDRILDAINKSDEYGAKALANDRIMELLYKNKINWEQAVLAIDNQNYTSDILNYMGICVHNSIQ